ncbi:MAG: hypothetical protein HY818_00690 [Acetobacterium woodii]|nr:hypothetical protein [Acetobacterium woodii]
MDMACLFKISLIGKKLSQSKAGFESFARENWGAYDGNNITKITIGSNVEMEGHVLKQSTL